MLVILLLIGGGIIFLLQTKDSSFNLSGKPRLGKGAAAPDFSLPGLDGKMITLADYKGKVVFLNIWATWCPPCVQEMPSMEKLYQELNGEGFEILAVSIDASGQLKDVVIRKSSGSRVLDQAALDILRRASPFDPFPAEISTEYDSLRFAYKWLFSEEFVPAAANLAQP